MRWLMAWLLWALLVPGVIDAEETKRSAYQTLHDAWEAADQQIGNDKDLAAAERRTRRADLQAAYTTRFLELAKREIASEAWVSCLIWIVNYAPPGAERDEMFALMGEHADMLVDARFQLQLMMSYLIKPRSERLDQALLNIVETHPDRGLRGAALYALAARAKQHGEEVGDVARCAEAVRLLERVLEEYPTVHTYAGENRELATELLADLRSPVALLSPAPKTLGTTLAGDDFELADSRRGKVTVLAFSGHWCGPCVAMHPVLRELQAKYPGDSLVIIEMNSDALDGLDQVRAKVVADGLNWVLVTDGQEGPIAAQWRIVTWPTYFVLDAEGRIRHRVSGNLGAKLIELVDGLMPRP